jgi:hypothetical protein
MKVFCLWCKKLIEVYGHIKFEGVYYSVCQECMEAQEEYYKEVKDEKKKEED